MTEVHSEGIPIRMARCPICDRVLDGQVPADWPQFPFCSRRCRLIDLGRWLGEDYRIPTEGDGEPSEEVIEDSDPP